MLSFRTHKKTAKRIVAIYPGRFQMPHRGHLHVFEYLHRLFPETYVTTSNLTELGRSPFTFKEKKSLLTFIGIPENKIVESINPSSPPEIKNNLDGNTALILCAGSKVQDEENRFSFKNKKDGSASYYQPYEENKHSLKSADEHGYIIFVPTYHFTVLGHEVKSASELRAMFKAADHETQKKLIIDLYGKYSEQIHVLLLLKLGTK